MNMQYQREEISPLKDLMDFYQKETFYFSNQNPTIGLSLNLNLFEKKNLRRKGSFASWSRLLEKFVHPVVVRYACISQRE